VLARVPSTEVLSRTTAAAGMVGQPGAAAAYAARLAAQRLPSNAELAASVAAGAFWNQSQGSASLTLASRPLDSMGLYHFTAEDYADGIGRCVGWGSPPLSCSIYRLVTFSRPTSNFFEQAAPFRTPTHKQTLARFAVGAPDFASLAFAGTTTGCSLRHQRTLPSRPNSQPQAPPVEAAAAALARRRRAPKQQR
jgi:hypothetical protein